MKTINDKAALYHCIIEADSAEGPDTEQMAELPPTGYNAIIIDGGALIHTMPPKPSCSTFDDYVATIFCHRLGVELKACDRLDVIWDRYFYKGIKGLHSVVESISKCLTSIDSIRALDQNAALHSQCSMPCQVVMSGLKSKGKCIWWNTLKLQKHLWRSHSTPSRLCQVMTSLRDDFVCRLYNTSTTSEVNVLRMNMFCQRSQDVQRIPPTQEALILHLQRAVYQASIWYTSHQPMLPEEDPSSFGWQEPNNNPTPRCTALGTATEVFKLTVKCGCRKHCIASCSCKREHLDCTPLCKCSCLKWSRSHIVNHSTFKRQQTEECFHLTP